MMQRTQAHEWLKEACGGFWEVTRKKAEKDVTSVPRLKSETRLSDVSPVTPLSWWRQKHFAAIVVGYLTMASLGASLIVFVYGMAATFRGWAVPNSIVPPFAVSDGLDGRDASEVLAVVDGPYNFQGDGKTYTAWRLKGSADELRRATDSEIRDGLVWRQGQTDHDRHVLDFVSDGAGDPRDEYQKVKPWVDEILATDDCRIAYIRLRTYPGQMLGASIWLFSPRKMLLVYLSVST